jgi:arylsulfatase A-like enzyme
MERASFSMWARTTDVAVTLPSHASMLTGVTPSTHGIVWNNDIPHPVYPSRPTLFELARRAGYTTAMVAGKSKFSALAKPGTLDWSFIPEKTVITDQAVADTAALWIARYAPQVLFVHLPAVDTAGHAEGWGSAAQLAAVATADRCIGQLLDALRERGVLDSTFVLVTSDHGGAGRSHGADDPRSRMIPWIAEGPGIRQDIDLTTDAGLEIRTEDTFATLCFLLGIPIPEGIDGRSVVEILSGRASKSSLPGR